MNAVEEIIDKIKKLTPGELATLELMLTGEDKEILEISKNRKEGKTKGYTLEEAKRELL